MNSTYQNDMLFARKLIDAVLEFMSTEEYNDNKELYSGGYIEYKENGILCFNDYYKEIIYYSANPYDELEYDELVYDFPFVDVTTEDGHFQMSLTMKPIHLRVAVLFTLMRNEKIQNFAIPMHQLTQYGIEPL